MSDGINLIGYATSPTGLGEDLRSFAAMLDYLNIPYSVTDVPTEAKGRVKYPWQNMTTDTYDTSFFFMSPMEFSIITKPIIVPSMPSLYKRSAP